MFSSTPFRLVYYLWLVPLSWLIMSCQDEIMVQQPAPAKTYAGDYKLTGTTSYTINGAISASPISGTLSVYATDTTNTYYFLERLTNSYQRGYLITLVDTTFTVEPVYDYNTYQYVNYYARQRGGGTFTNKHITLDRYVNTNAQIYVTPVSGDKTTYALPINKHVHLTATR